MLRREAIDDESEGAGAGAESIRVGEAFQAAIPAYMEHRAAQPNPHEARFLSCPLYIPKEEVAAAAGTAVANGDTAGPVAAVKRGRTKASFTAGAARQAALAEDGDGSGREGGEAAGTSGRGGVDVWDPRQLRRYALRLKAIERPAERQKALEEILDAQDAALGRDLVVKLGLDKLGVKLRAAWGKEDEVLFAEGMFRKYKKFKWLRKM